MKFQKKLFQRYDGKEVNEYIIETDTMKFAFLDFGARIHKILTDQLNEKSNIIFSFNSIEDHLNFGGFAGATIGRVGGRISHGRFKLNGKAYQVERNLGEHHLHGGSQSIDKKIWNCEEVIDDEWITLKFSTVIKSADDGYPGDMDVEVHHTVTEDNEWIIEYFAKSTEDTLFNPTNHVYFNLNQDVSQLVNNHELWIDDDQFAELDENMIPTGVMKRSPNFDFSTMDSVAKGIDHPDDDNKIVNGYDHPFLLSNHLEKKFRLFNPDNSITVEGTTDRDCVVVYTANGVDFTSEDGVEYKNHSGIALETQSLPDAINHDGFGDIVLKTGKEFYSKTRYKVSK